MSRVTIGSPPLPDWNHRKETGRLGPPPATHPLLRKSSPHAQVPPVARRCRHRRRRHRRLVHRLPPHQDRHHEHGAARAQAAHLRNDLARGGPRHAAARQPQPHRARQVHDRALRGAGTGDRPGDGLQAERVDHHRAHAGAVRGGDARRLDGEELRAGGERHLDRRDQGAPAPLQSRWRGRRRVPAEGRPGESHRRDAGARRRRPEARRQGVREHQGDAHPGRRTGAPSASRRRTARSAPTRS